MSFSVKKSFSNIDTSPEEALQFLDKMSDKVKAHAEAFVMSKILIGRIHLINNNLATTKVAG